MNQLESRPEKIELLTQISLDINEVKDLDLLLDRILTNVRKFFNADAGSIYIRKGNRLHFSHSQNQTLQKQLGPHRKLIYHTFSIPIDNSSIAGYVANNQVAVNIENVYELTGTEPYRFDSHFDELTNYKTQAMLSVPMTNQQGELLGVMQVINPLDEKGNVIPFDKSDERIIRHFATSAALALERAQVTRDIILRMIMMAELRDPQETGSHVNRVASYSVEIFEAWARRKGMARAELEKKKDTLRMAAMLHDVGKIAISDQILKKPDRLTPEEYEIMKSHTYLGARLFKDKHSDFDAMASEVALNHHERWDGTGYPGHVDPLTGNPVPGFCDSHGRPLPKKGREIPLFGRIVAIADVYDALSSERYYKERWQDQDVLEEIRKGAGTHFDPELVEAFFSCLDVIRSIARRYPDNQEPH